MRTRQKRTIIKGKDDAQLRNEIRNIIEETGMRYVLIPNGIFDDLYIQAEVNGVFQEKIDDETGKKKTVWNEGQTQFTELDMTVYIFLQFMMVNKFTLNYEKFASYIGCSSKQLKVVLKRLQHFKGKTNAIYFPYEDKVKIVDEMEVPLISEKVHSAYNPKTKKNQKSLHWYTNFIPNYKLVKKGDKEEVVPMNFFMVTLDDLDLLTDKKLTRNEFVTYLFFLKAYKYGTDDNHQMWWRLSTLAETLKYKLVGSVHKHVEKILNLKIDDIPLLEELRPKNYDLQIIKGEEPSSRYIPRYNPSKMSEMNFGKQEMDSLNEEMSFEKVEMDSDKVEIGSQKEEVNSQNKEIDSDNLEAVYAELEMDFLN